VTAARIDRLIVNGPFKEPTRYWTYEPQESAFVLKTGRRPAGFVRASGSGNVDDPGIFVPLELPNRIRDRVREWREAGYPSTTGVTRRLLQHWNDPGQRQFQFFFCQIEAIETLIWLAEASPADKLGIAVPYDGGPFQRFCSKMATGSGKTTVMAMLIAWHVLNKATNNQDRRFSKSVFIVCPGLTVKQRLQVLKPSVVENYYDLFGIVPSGMRHLLNQGQVLIENWHSLAPIDPNKGPKVVKKGPESDEAFCRRVLANLGGARNLLVINDEAHHAWRVTNDSALSKEEQEEATLWVSGLDRIDASRGILSCHDFTATPFVPRGKNSTDELLFDWIVSDFGLNDAIESGLVKTPRIVVREDALPDAKTFKPKLYHIYSDESVRDDLSRKGALPTEPLPTLVNSAYLLLGFDWLAAKKAWEEASMPTPPVMITVANRTETAARIANAFKRNSVLIPALCDPERLLHIDSKVLREAEERDETTALDDSIGEEDDKPATLTRLQQAELLRQQVDTVGQVGKPGEKMQNIISVGMLSEGWDARTVTHIMGLRAFTSQLLCEQVVGRGLRRAVYNDFDENGFLKPEYVNVFGVPFTFLPVEGQEGERPNPPAPAIRIEAVPEKSEYLIKWPNVIRINHVFRRDVALDLSIVEPLILDALKNPTLAQLAPVVDGKPKIEQIAEIDLKKVADEYRLQRVAFQVARDIFNQEAQSWKGDKAFLMSRIVDIAQEFIESNKIEVVPPLFATEPMRRRLLVALYMSDIVHHLWAALVPQNTQDYELIFDDRLPVRTTGDMTPWYTSKPHYPAERSHLNFAVIDSGLEGSVAYLLDRDDRVEAWAKNDHLQFELSYVYRGGVFTYRPDYIVRLSEGHHAVLEVKGQEVDRDRAKGLALKQWIAAVSADGRFGRWDSATVYAPSETSSVITKCLDHAATAAS
jgi:type III restriction enzyme